MGLLGLRLRSSRPEGFMVGMVGSFTVRIALMFAALFTGAIGLALLGIQISIADTASAHAQRDMTETAARFEREWNAAARTMHGEASLLAKDFGFRRAAATGDTPTIESALLNLARRGGRPLALFIGTEGAVAGERRQGSVPGAALIQALEAERRNGTLVLGNETYWTVAEPVDAPQRIGWVLFGERLDGRGLAGSSFAPPPFMRVRIEKGAALPEGLKRRLSDNPQREAVTVRAEGAVTRVLPLPALLRDSRREYFVLSFSLAAATAEYRSVAIDAATICLLVLLVVLAASWLLARRLSRPIDALGAAVDEVAAGRQVALDIRGGDVFGRMARSLSGMSQTIAELSHSARHDALTMLPNRRAFQEQLEAALSARQPATLILVDLDRFKPVNDTYGHPVGDALLQGIAHRLGRAASRVRGTAARLGGTSSLRSWPGRAQRTGRSTWPAGSSPLLIVPSRPLASPLRRVRASVWRARPMTGGGSPISSPPPTLRFIRRKVPGAAECAVSARRTSGSFPI
nr:diguanylate cyclase [Pacificimonas flava]